MTLCLTRLAICEGVAIDPVFGDHMVLQRDAEIRVSGTAAPGENVSVSFHKKIESAKADENGNWSVKLAPLPADAEPSDLTVTGGSSTATLRDILVGDVWLCSGQSNMEFPLSREISAPAAIAAASDPLIRLFDYRSATRGVAGTPFNHEQIKRLNEYELFSGQWEVCSPKTARDFSAIGYFFAKEIQPRANIPVGVISCAVGGSPTESWIYLCELYKPANRDILSPDGNWLDNPRLDSWCKDRARQNLAKAIESKEIRSFLGPLHPFKPGYLFAGGIRKLSKLSVRGVLWYQGESNSLEDFRVAQHEKLFPLLVGNWREKWNFGNIPFYYCQLSSIGTEKGYKSQFWPEFRDQQRRFLETLPNVGMVVTSDLGDRADVHPRNKHEVGRRLALLALAKSYGQNIAFSGPLPAAAHEDGRNVVVTFKFADKGLKTSDSNPPAAFELAGSDGNFHPATAQIDGARVILSNPNVNSPKIVRYAWQPYSPGTLINGDNLPASTFQLSVSAK